MRRVIKAAVLHVSIVNHSHFFTLSIVPGSILENLFFFFFREKAVIVSSSPERNVWKMYDVPHPYAKVTTLPDTEIYRWLTCRNVWLLRLYLLMYYSVCGKFTLSVPFINKLLMTGLLFKTKHLQNDACGGPGEYSSCWSAAQSRPESWVQSQTFWRNTRLESHQILLSTRAVCWLGVIGLDIRLQYFRGTLKYVCLFDTKFQNLRRWSH